MKVKVTQWEDNKPRFFEAELHSVSLMDNRQPYPVYHLIKDGKFIMVNDRHCEVKIVEHKEQSKAASQALDKVRQRLDSAPI